MQCNNKMDEKLMRRYCKTICSYLLNLLFAVYFFTNRNIYFNRV